MITFAPVTVQVHCVPSHCCVTVNQYVGGPVRKGSQRGQGGALHGAKWIIVFIVTLCRIVLLCSLVCVSGRFFVWCNFRDMRENLLVIITGIMNFVIYQYCVNGKGR